MLTTLPSEIIVEILARALDFKAVSVYPSLCWLSRLMQEDVFREECFVVFNRMIRSKLWPNVCTPFVGSQMMVVGAVSNFTDHTFSNVNCYIGSIVHKEIIDQPGFYRRQPLVVKFVKSGHLWTGYQSACTKEMFRFTSALIISPSTYKVEMKTYVENFATGRCPQCKCRFAYSESRLCRYCEYGQWIHMLAPEVSNDLLREAQHMAVVSRGFNYGQEGLVSYTGQEFDNEEDASRYAHALVHKCRVPWFEGWEHIIPMCECCEKNDYVMGRFHRCGIEIKYLRGDEKLASRGIDCSEKCFEHACEVEKRTLSFEYVRKPHRKEKQIEKKYARLRESWIVRDNQ